MKINTTSALLVLLLGGFTARAEEPAATTPVTAPAAAEPPAAPPPAPAPAATPSNEEAPFITAKEEICDDKIDNDGDTVYDCGDADCAEKPYCKPDGQPEGSNARCSDWLDNDGDGAIDCDDGECKRSHITVCTGSWQGDASGDGGTAPAHGATAVGVGGTPAPAGDNKVYKGEVEQPDSEGGIGFVGVRFGIVAAVQQLFTSTNETDPAVYQTRLDTRFDTLQLRAFGQLPMLEDSFFLLSMQASQSPRLSFALFQFPLGGGHYININTGGSTLSSQPLVSAAKRPLLDTPNYLLRPFDQFLDAGVEVNGPIILTKLRYRVFAGGGTGLFGDFGGRFFEDASLNPTYSVGAQLWATPVGMYGRFDSPFLYRSVPMALAIAFGGKYEQREQERFPAVHGTAVFRYGLFQATAESYTKAEINFGQFQTANYLQLGLLVWPEVFFLATDVGHYSASDYGALTSWTGGLVPIAGDLANIPNGLQRSRRYQVQSRTALHWFFWRQNGVMSLRYTFDYADPIKAGVSLNRAFPVISHEVVLQAQLRF